MFIGFGYFSKNHVNFELHLTIEHYACKVHFDPENQACI